jgi:hypothetical protein
MIEESLNILLCDPHEIQLCKRVKRNDLRHSDLC